VSNFIVPLDDPKFKRRCACEFSGGGFPAKTCSYHQKLLDTINELREAAKDAELMDWLEQNATGHADANGWNIYIEAEDADSHGFDTLRELIAHHRALTEKVAK